MLIGRVLALPGFEGLLIELGVVRALFVVLVRVDVLDDDEFALFEAF